MESCSSCRYSRRGTQSNGAGPRTPIYWCHRYAPRPGIVSDWDRWPEVRSFDWCGEWAPDRVTQGRES
jgi:hypothetical protein